MKYIFLDIDGVMKPGRSYFCPTLSTAYHGGFDPLAVAALNKICEKTGASIVFNTTWNRLNIIDIAEGEGIIGPIVGKTKYPLYSDRLEAIKSYLSDNPAEEWVALDDCPIKHERAILVNPDDGISCQNYRDACKILGNPDCFMLLL